VATVEKCHPIPVQSAANIPKPSPMSLGTKKLAVKVLEVVENARELVENARVLEVVDLAMVREDKKGLLLRLRKELGRALTRFASSTIFTNKQTNLSTLKPNSAASRASGGTAPTPAARPSSLLPAV
jgi:hypothetical protein